MQELLTALMILASAYTGLPVPDHTPDIKFIGACELKLMYSQEKYCVAGSGGATALYTFAEIIYLPNTWKPDNISDLSDLFHETVHHLQHNVSPIQNAPCVGAIEELAYEAQIKFLEANRMTREQAMLVMQINPIFLKIKTSCD